MRWYSVEAEHRPILTDAFPDAELLAEPFTLAGAQDTRVLVLRLKGSDRITDDALERMPSLTHLVTLSTGTDHIDLAACARRGVTVHSIPDYSTESVAEHAFAMLLALARALDEPGRRPRELDGKRLGIVGAGAIGQALMRFARAAGMECIAHDVVTDRAAAERIGFTYAPLDEVLRCDAVSLHAPLTEETYHLLSRERLAQLPDGAIIINTARGGLIDTPALMAELKTGRLLAGLDVLAIDGNEDVWDSHIAEELRQLPNVFLTEHTAGNSREARLRALEHGIAIVKELRGTR